MSDVPVGERVQRRRVEEFNMHCHMYRFVLQFA